MKTFSDKFILFIPVLLLTLVSCSDKLTGEKPASPVCLKINSVSAPSLSRAAVMGTSFPTDEDVSIGVFTYSESSGYTYTNIKYTRKAGQSEWVADKELLISDRPVTVYAYYPWQDGAGTATIDVTSSINGKDWMWATPVGNVSVSNPTVNLSMNHFFALVELIFNVPDRFADGGGISSVSLACEGAALTGTVNILGGAVSGNSPMTGENILSGAVVLPIKDGVARTSCLLIPYRNFQNDRFAVDISCTVGGQTFSASIPQTAGIIVRPGAKSTINLTIKDNLLIADPAEITVKEGEAPSDPFVEEADDASADFISKTLDCSKLKDLKHPRLFLTAAGFEDLEKKVTVDRFSYKNLYKLNKMVLDLADVCLSGSPIEYKLNDSKRLLDQSREALKRLFACSYAFKITGRPKYRDKAREDLVTVCSFKDWHPAHWLDVGEMALGVAIAYDWLYYSLTLEERALIHRKLVDYCIVASKGESFRKNKGNWNQVCYCGALAAAIAVYEKDKTVSGQLISDLLTDNRSAMQGIYSPDGNYYEGYDYWGYGTGFQVMILQMLKTAFGTMFDLDKTDGFLKTADYMLFMAGPCGKCFPYADGGTSNERPNLAMWWFAAYRNDISLLFNEMRLFEAGAYPTCVQARMLPMLPCMVKDFNIEGTPSAPSSIVWSGKGVKPMVMVRKGWTFGEDDAYFGLVGGYANVSHGHLDAGSFVYDALGYRWSDDYTRPDYGTMESALASAGGDLWNLKQTSLRWDIFKQNNLAHSTISVMNTENSNKLHASDHLVGSSTVKSTLEETYTSADAPGGKINMTAAVSDGLASAKRSIKLISGSKGPILEITDELSALSYRKAEIQWRMNTPSSVTVGTDGIVLTQGGRKMKLTTSSSNQNVAPAFQDFGKVRPTGWIQRSWDTNLTNNIAGFSATIPANNKVTFTTRISPE